MPQSGHYVKRLKNKVHELKFHSIQDIIEAAKEGELPDNMMITIHPKRWHDVQSAS